MSHEQAISNLEQDLKDRYPRARVTVTADSNRVTVEVATQPDDSFKVTLDPDRIEYGSAVLARIFQRTNLVVTSPDSQRTDSRNPEMLAFNPQETQQ